MTYELFIIDAISPFFIKHPDKQINWSKIPFDRIERKGRLKKKQYLRIKKDFERYIDKISDIGYNAISIDDLCHLAVLDIYHTDLQTKLKKYCKRYRRLFKYAKESHLKIFVTTDIMFFNEDIRRLTANRLDDMIDLMKQAIIQVFEKLPEIDGIIFRMGEADGIDVSGDFISKLVLKTPADIRRFLNTILPVFEHYNKKLIYRTWTIGVHRVGDLIWNQNTYKQSFDSIDSENFIVSMKHGEGDFFRYLELNRCFVEDDKHLKLLEIQTRREYEGFGQFPNFIGWEYQTLFKQLENNNRLIGINVWCQTGGWSRNRSLSFLKKSSFFTELNTSVVLALFKKGLSVETAVAEFCPEKNQQEMIQFLKYADEVTTRLLYEPEFAQQQLYFNRIRVPPLFYVFWQYVTLTGPIIEVLRYYADSPEKSISQAETAFKNIQQMEILNSSLNLNYDHQYYQDTFELFLHCREVIFNNKDYSEKNILSKCQSYSKKYPHGYQFSIKPPSKLSSAILKLIIPVCIRRQKNYRWFEPLLFNYITSKLYTFLSKRFARELPDFVNKQAMPIEQLLR